VIGKVLIAGAVYALLAGGKDQLVIQARTGNSKIDRLTPLIVRSAKKRLGAKATPNVIRALVAILSNESGGNPAMYLGDKTLSGGPSIGPMQVYRKTALDFRLWTPPDGVGADSEKAKAAYAALASNEARGIDMGVAVFKQKLAAAKGDVAEAIRRYNGSGPASEAYKTKALEFMRRTWA